MSNNRSGAFVKQLSGDSAYNAFIPNALPPNPPLVFDHELITLLSKADQAVGKLDGLLNTIPNPDLFVMMFIKREAVLSAQIEGTQASLTDLLEKEEAALGGAVDDDIQATTNYVRAMNYGLERVKTLPLSLRLIKEVHAILLDKVRGQEKSPGEFRENQNWVGPPGYTLRNALYIPPPVHEMKNALGEWEKYLHAEKKLPILIECGLIHSQFETIHPFLDGNGRIGRLLITLFLCLNKTLTRPTLYLSYFFKKNREEYYGRLQKVRTDGDWENWQKFFLRGIAETAENGVVLARRIMELKDRTRAKLDGATPRLPTKAPALLDLLFITPVLTVGQAAEQCRISFNTAKRTIDRFIELGILTEHPGRKKGRRYYFLEYLTMLNEGTEL